MPSDFLSIYLLMYQRTFPSQIELSGLEIEHKRLVQV